MKQDCMDYEILIIDQTTHHDRDTSIFLKNLPPIARVINNEIPSLTMARNKGIREAKGDVIIMIDDDVIIGPTFIYEHLKYYDDPLVGGVTGKISTRRKSKSIIHLLLKNEFLKWVSPTAFQSSKEQDALRFAGGNFSFRKSILNNIGYFDKNFIGTAWAEELDFSIRFKNNGYKIIYNPKAEIYHLELQEGGCNKRTRFNFDTVHSYSYNMSYFIEKNKLNRLFYIYLIVYIYKRVFFKKDYISIKGFIFIYKSTFIFIKGLLKGFLTGRKHIYIS